MGDYKTKQLHHPIMNYEYFERALHHIVTKDSSVNEGRVLYFCEQEDNAFVTAHIHRLQANHPAIEFQKVDDQIPDYDQLLIMSCCSHNIMANSTFSWWSAFLKSDPKSVSCPRTKNVAQNLFSEEMLLEGWQLFDVEKETLN
jgi:hypothetical protein